MNIFGPYLIFSVVLLDDFLLHSQASTDAYKDNKEDVNKMCSTTAYVRDFLDIHINNLKGSRACNVTLEPNERKNTLKAYFKKNEYKVGSTCTGAINLYDAHNAAQLGDAGYCKAEAPKGLYELGSKGLLTISPGDSSVDTVVRVVEYYLKDKDCPDDKFDCDHKNLCIKKSMECDKSSDCPNSKDEGDDCKEKDYTTLYRVLMIVGIVASFVVCAVVVWEESSRRKRANLPLPVNRTITPGKFDGAYAHNFGQQQTKPTIYFPSSFDPPPNPDPAPEPPSAPVYS